MENKLLFDVRTTWQFPVLRYTTNASYVEVRKASGIAYILLQLISSSDENSEKLVAILKSLGVPSDIHYILAGELANMISYEIIQLKFGRDFSTDLIDEYAISDFKITNLGKKLFAEGTIPTGRNEIKRIHAYYDVSRNDTQIKFDGKLFQFDKSALDENCIGDIILNDSDIEMFVNENKFKYGFRKGELISGFEHNPPEVCVYRVEDAVTLKITSEFVQLQAKEKSRDNFIHKFYTAEAITRIMNAKGKYRFPPSIASEIKEYDYNDFENIVEIKTPSQFAELTNVHCQLSLARAFQIKGSECSIEEKESAELMHQCGIDGVASYFENGHLYSIVPGRFLFDVEGFSGRCILNLVTVQQLNEEVQKRLMENMLLNCLGSPVPLERSQIIKQLNKISTNKDYLERFASALLAQTNICTEKIDTFLKLDAVFSKEHEWAGFAISSAEHLLQLLCEQISIDEFVAQNILGEKLMKIIGLPEIEYLSKIAKPLIENEGDIIAYDALERAGFSVDIALSTVNVFGLYCTEILNEVHLSGNSGLRVQCALLGKSLSELKDITGIVNPYEDSAKLDFDNDRFIQVMGSFTDTIKKLEKHKAYAQDQYKIFLAFRERFAELKEVVTIEKEAFRSPKHINKNYIEQKLKKSRYKEAICDLHIRLQYELNRLYNTKNIPTNDLLNHSEMSGYLTKSEVDDMHMLRRCRNQFQHPNQSRNIQYSEEIIKDWCIIVEKLGELDNESRGEN